MGKRVKLPGRAESAEMGGIVTGAGEILDDLKGKTQEVINAETDAELVRLEETKQGNLSFDQTPTEDSTNPVMSGGVYAADQMLSQAIEAILLLIPAAASELNKLVDLATMNSSISTATASFKGTYNLVSDLHLTVSATHAQIAAALDALSLGADNNDYAFVQVPNTDTAPTDIAKTERYKFNGENWAYEYDLNNSGFTTAQWNAINSGITTLLVAKLSALPTNEALTLALAGKQDNLTFDNAPTAGSNNPVKSGGIYTRNNEIVALINALDAAKQNVLTFDTTPINGSTNPVTSNGVYLAIQLVQTAVVALDGRMGTAETKISTAEGNIVNLQAAYAALTQSDIVVVSGALPSSGQQQNIIYRQPDQDHTPPQFYSDYMWNGTAWVLMATYNNAIDPRPKKASQNLVTSGGVFDNMGALDVSELNATENPHTLKPYATLDAALADIPSDYQKGGMSIKYVQTSDNKYVKFFCLAQNFTTDITQWAICEESVYVENPEFVYVKTDKDGKILWSIKADGGIYYGVGVPQQVKDYIEEKISSLSLDEYEDIVAFLSDYLGSDTTLKTLLDSKLDAEGLDSDALATVQAVESPEYIQVTTDSEDKILEGITSEGIKQINLPIETPSSTMEHADNSEYIEAKTDSEGKLLAGRTTDGAAFENISFKTPILNTERINFSGQGLHKLEQDLIDDGFNPGSGDDVVKSVSIAGVPIPKNLNDVPMPIASTEQYGLMSPQDKTKLGTIQPTINITGSGVTKNASSFGFLPTATAAENNVAIAAALDGGGTILVDLPGIYDISKSIIIPSNTTLVFGANTFVRMQADMYAVINAGAYTRTYDENIKLIGLHLIANGYGVPMIDIENLDEHNRVPEGMIVGLHGYVDFFYVKKLLVYEYIILDQQSTGYGLHMCTFEDIVVERVHIKGEKDGIHFSGRGKRAVVKDCFSQCYDDGCTFNAVDWSTSTPEVGWLEDILVDNSYDLVHPNHASAGFYSRFMGGAWKDWEEDMEVQLNSIVVVEEDGFKKMYRVTGHQNERGFKYISHTKPSVKTFGEVEFLDEQTVTRTIGGVTETKTMKIAWILTQTQEVRYDGGCRNITLRDIHLQKTRTFTIQYYQDNEWFNAIVPNAQGTSVQSNITFERVIQECELVDSDYPRFVVINCPVKNINIKDCYIKHRVLLSDDKVNIEGLTYPEATMTVAGNTFTDRDLIKVALINGISNRIRLYGNILENSNCTVQNSGATFVQNDIV